MQQLAFRSRCGARAVAAPRASRISSAIAPRRVVPAVPVSHTRSGRLLCRAALAQKAEDVPCIQLGTAPVPKEGSMSVFVDSLYQWAATLGQSGANYPTILPLKVDKLENGFQIGLMKRVPGPAGGVASAGDIQVTVEDVDTTKQGLFIRFYEGPASLVDRRTPAPSDPQQRLDAILSTLVDVDTIMGTMPNAIRQATAKAKAS